MAPLIPVAQRPPALVVRRFQLAASSPRPMSSVSSPAKRPHGFLEVVSDHFDAACDLTHMPHERAELKKHPVTTGGMRKCSARNSFFCWKHSGAVPIPMEAREW